MDAFRSFHATWLSVLIGSNRNSVVSGLFGLLYRKALVNNHLLFVIVKQILAEFYFHEFRSFVIYRKGNHLLVNMICFYFPASGSK